MGAEWINYVPVIALGFLGGAGVTGAICRWQYRKRYRLVSDEDNFERRAIIVFSFLCGVMTAGLFVTLLAVWQCLSR